MQSVVAEEVNRRIAKATSELQERYESGQGGFEDPDVITGPTGSAYKEKHNQEQKLKKAEKDKLNAINERKKLVDQVNKEDIDEYDLDEEDKDSELYQLRMQRLNQMKNEHMSKINNLAKGHGQYREITQDEFLTEVTTSTHVIVHFYHRDFPRCNIMDHHLSKLATRHIETKFIKIDSDKAPFFIEKLIIRSIPTVVLFIDGIAADKIIGFQGLCDNMPEGHEDEWRTVTLANLLANKRMIKKELIIDDEDEKEKSLAKMNEIRKLAMSKMTFDDDDFSD